MNKVLNKEISLISAFSIAAGAMISSGLFVLPMGTGNNHARRSPLQKY